MKVHQLTKLNPRTASLQVGSGGQPAITPEDIASELATLQDKPLDLYVFCLRYAPGMAPMQRKAAHLELMSKAMVEWRHRANQVHDKMVALGITQASANREKIQQALDELTLAEENLWPGPRIKTNQKANYLDVFQAVAKEVQQQQTCEPCKGTGELPATPTRPITTCRRCRGSGLVRWSDHARAEACGMHDVVYKRGWDQVYVWCLKVMRAVRWRT